MYSRMNSGMMNHQNKPESVPTLAEIQEEAAKLGVKVTDGSARFKAIGIVGGVAPWQGETANAGELSKDR